MLGVCAPGHRCEKGKSSHKWRVLYKGKTFWELPKGGHDNKEQVQLMKIAKLARILEINPDCARREMPALQGLNLGDRK